MTGETQRDLDVVVVCEINVDIVVTGLAGPPVFGAEYLVDNVTLTAGGSGPITASGLAALGLRVGICGLIGDDSFGHTMLDYLTDWDVDRSGVVVDPAETTGASVLLSTSRDRAILTVPGAMARFALDRIRFDVLARARHLHLSSYFLQSALRPGVPILLDQAHALGLTVSADTGHDPAETWHVENLLPHLDLFLPNEVEARAITGAADAATALERLAPRVPTVAVKCGGEGSLAARGAERLFVPAFPATVLDATGAGDAFDAGFLSGYLAGESLERCLYIGNACGALTVAHIGGTGALSPYRVSSLLTTPG